MTGIGPLEFDQPGASQNVPSPSVTASRTSPLSAGVAWLNARSKAEGRFFHPLGGLENLDDLPASA